MEFGFNTAYTLHFMQILILLSRILIGLLLFDLNWRLFFMAAL